MKLNELICPKCGLKCLTSSSYVTCDSCQTHFTASQSRSVDNPVPLQPPYQVGPIQIGPIVQDPVTYPWPYLPPSWPYGDRTGTKIEIKPIWIAPIPGAAPPYGPTVVCGTDGTVETGVTYHAVN
ncbi:MAG: hypothetical protein AB7L09_00790 [Nitrospira sp.]